MDGCGDRGGGRILSEARNLPLLNVVQDLVRLNPDGASGDVEDVLLVDLDDGVLAAGHVRQADLLPS